jgi:hypothetical protein
MTLHRFSAALTSGVLLLSLLLAVTACDSSTGIGGDVGEDDLQGGAPTAFDLAADSASFAATSISPPITGNTDPNATWRFLVGRVYDPLAGTATAEGYFDLAPPASIPQAILDAQEIDLRAELSLEPQYVHGDTTASVDVTLYDLEENVNLGGARADEAFTDSVEVATYTLAADADSTVTLVLPDEWLRDHIRQLRDTSTTEDGVRRFTPNFKGLHFRAENSVGPGANGAVVGFSTRDSRFRLVRTDTTVSATYSISQSFTSVDWSEPPSGSVPSDRVLLRGGDDRALQFSVPFAEKVKVDSLVGAPLNRVRLEVPLDSTGLAPEVSNFVRPNVLGYRFLMRRNTTDADVPECASRELSRLQPHTEATGLDPQDNPGELCFMRPVDRSQIPQSIGTGGTVQGQSSLFQLVDVSLEPNRPVVFEGFRIEILDRFSQTSNQLSASPGVPTTAPALFFRPETADSQNRPRLSIVATPL